MYAGGYGSDDLSPLLLFITRRYRLPSCTANNGLVLGHDFPLMVQRFSDAPTRSFLASQLDYIIGRFAATLEAKTV